MGVYITYQNGYREWGISLIRGVLENGGIYNSLTRGVLENGGYI